MSPPRKSSKSSVPTHLGEFVDGIKLYGDDFDPKHLVEWFEDEAGAYPEVEASGEGHGSAFLSHAKNVRYGFRFLPRVEFENVLGFGAADAREFGPILHSLKRITVVEPTGDFDRSFLGNVPINYVRSSPDGRLRLSSNSFDLTTSLGALHHVANVSFVAKELYRTLRPGGYMLVDEPTVSMGNWWEPRRGATKRERGIPYHIMRDIVTSIGFEIVQERRVYFAPATKLSSALRIHLHSIRSYLPFDDILCSVFYWNTKYHPTSVLEWLQPTNVFYVLRKPQLQMPLGSQGNKNANGPGVVQQTYGGD